MSAYKSLIFTDDFRCGMREVVTQLEPEDTTIRQTVIGWSFWNLFKSRSVVETNLIPTHKKGVQKQHKHVHFMKVDEVKQSWKGDSLE